MKVTKDQLRRIIQETVRRKLELGPEVDDWTVRPYLQIEGKTTTYQLQQMIDEEFALALNEACSCGGMDEQEMPEEMSLEGDELDEVTPPGGEKVVKALKKKKGVKNPWAVAWAMKNKGSI